MAAARVPLQKLSVEERLKLYLAERDGCVSLEELAKHLGTLVGAWDRLPPAATKQWLRQKKQSFIVLNVLDTAVIKPYAFLLLGFQLCHFYQLNDCRKGASCDRLHLCKDFINNDGSCQRGASCPLSHTFRDMASNQTIIDSLHFQDLPDRTLQRIVTNSLPHVCNVYNMSSCTSAYCAKIHICWDHVEGMCRKQRCSLSHDLSSEHNQIIIKHYGLARVPHGSLLANILTSTFSKEIEWLIDEDKFDDSHLSDKQYVNQGARPKSSPVPRSIPRENYQTKEMVKDVQLVSQGARPKSNPTPGNKPTQDLQTEERERDSHLVNLIFHYIVSEHQGRVSLPEFIKRRPLDITTIKDEDLPSWFEKHQNKFVLNKKASGELDSVCVLEPRARICIDYGSKRGCSKVRCNFFHLCRGYINHTCTFNEKSCKFNHTLDSDRQKGLIEKLNLQQFTDKEVMTIIKYSIPFVCKEYNEGGCSKVNACIHLHICDGFVANDNSFCTNLNKCSRSHDLSSRHEQTLLKQFRMDRMKEFVTCRIISPSHKRSFVTQHRDRGVAPKPTNPNRPFLHDGENIAICDAFLRKFCPKKDQCPLHHWNVPYAWRHRLSGQTKWMAFGAHTTDILEKNYCNSMNRTTIKPEEIITNGTSKVEIDLDALVASYQDGKRSLSYQIERLSTVSSSEAGPDNKFATNWVWYWQDDDASWKKYDANLNIEIEKAFLQKNASVTFPRGRFQYSLNLQVLGQLNLSTKKYRAIRRRPIYVQRPEAEFSQDVINRPAAAYQLGLRQQPQPGLIPPHWEKMPKDMELKLVELPRKSEEFKKVDQEFLKSLGGKYSIIKVQRVQNTFLWKKFVTKKQHLQKKLQDSKNVVNERLLFHGTSKEIVQAICKQNFDWRVCGKHGTSYGQGTYFATDASYSHGYSSRSHSGIATGIVPTNSGYPVSQPHYGQSHSLTPGYPIFHMFLAKVLVGSYTKGNSSLTRPPPLYPSDPASDLYDSCVNSISNPTMFIIFESDQCYPQYLIEYKEGTYVPSHDPHEMLRSFSNLSFF